MASLFTTNMVHCSKIVNPIHPTYISNQTKVRVHQVCVGASSLSLRSLYCLLPPPCCLYIPCITFLRTCLLAVCSSMSHIAPCRLPIPPCLFFISCPVCLAIIDRPVSPPPPFIFVPLHKPQFPTRCIQSTHSNYIPI